MRQYSFTVTGTVHVADDVALAQAIGPVCGFSSDGYRAVEVELPPGVAILALLARAVEDGLERPGLDGVRVRDIDVEATPSPDNPPRWP